MLSNFSTRWLLVSATYNARVFILDDVTAPDVTIDAPANVTSTAANLSGTVNPNANPNVGWHFEISADDANWTPTDADQDPGTGNAPVAVSQNLTDLVPNTAYFVRVVAQRAFNARAISSEQQFTTLAVAPDVTTDIADDVSPDHAVLTGLINAHHNPTTYYFQYGTSTAYGTSVPPSQDGDAGASNDIVQVLQRIDGLQPATTYHYRLLATNSAGSTPGTDQTFTTTASPPPSTVRPGIPGTGFLPDNRAWEKASPEDKNGGDILPDNGRTRVATDGNAVSFGSLTDFGDVIGASTATDYMGVRGPGGWSTHALTPGQRPNSVLGLLQALQPRYVGAFSADLSKGVFLGISPLIADPDVADVANIYRRDDLKNPNSGSYQLLSACPLCATTGTPLPPL